MKKNLLLAGCNGDLAGEVSKNFRENGWNVIGMDIEECGNLGSDSFIKCDITDAKAVKNAVDEIEKTADINGVFNAAGYRIDKGFLDTGSQEWEALLNTILGGSANLCKAAAPYMTERREGSILLLSPDYAKDTGENICNAVASCTLHGFGKSFGVEMAPFNVLINVLSANTPFDIEAIADTVYYMIAENTYTAAQVISITGRRL